ncbi:MAG: flagellar protein FliT [Halopseudomonas sp.]
MALKPLDSKAAQQCIVLSKLLLELAQKEEWQRFEALLAKRDRLLKPIVTQDYAASDADAVRGMVGQIQALDKQTQSLVETNKHRALESLRGDATKKKAVSAYQKAQRRY